MAREKKPVHKETEMDSHLGYEKSECSDSDDYRNGYKSKRINSNYGSIDIILCFPIYIERLFIILYEVFLLM